MLPSRRYSFHIERSTSVGDGDIGSSAERIPHTDDDYIPTIIKKKFQPQPDIEKPSQKMNTELKGSKPAEQSNATRPSQDRREPSQNPSNLLKQAASATAELLSHVSAANSMSKDEEHHSTRPQLPVIEGIFFIGRELSRAKKIDEVDELELFGKFIKKCTLCKKEFMPEKDVYMYSDRPFCSPDCRDCYGRDTRKDFKLGKED